ncbi:hypothetical protein [Streptomyces luteireticuli]|uniref:Uncharacterized protein n=1 Tax=Streptomyces luteireticuli TaxID=173858 RepID=A0ABN0Z2R9_9ACTN
MRRAIVAAALVAVSVLGAPTVAQARPADGDPFDTCLLNGGNVDWDDELGTIYCVGDDGVKIPAR